MGFEPSLGRAARQGSLDERAGGTFAAAVRAAAAGRGAEAADLLAVSVLEAEELRDIYQRWPELTASWIADRGVEPALLEDEQARLGDLIGQRAMAGIEAEWPAFTDAVDVAAARCRAADPSAVAAIDAARATWMGIHDRAVDRVSGLVDIAVRLVGEDHLGALWDSLMGDWYDVHEQRYALTSQPWTESARQLAVAILDGFHAHLTGVDRSGEVAVIDEADRVGFRFAPCGSGGRSVAAGITDGQPRAGAPFDFAVTTRPHDWAWNTVGICSYCVHCCQLNEVMPIDRLGYPTRVIEPPTWPSTDPNPACTWWVYRDPSLVPDWAYTRVGRDPGARPAAPGERP